MRSFLSAILICTSALAIAQPVEDYRKYKELAPNAEAIASAYQVDLNISLEDDKIKVKYHTNEEFFLPGQ